MGNCLLHKARQKVNINLNCTIKNNTQQDFSALEGLMNDFFPFAQEQIGFNKPVDVVLQSSLENSEDPLGKTGYYDPSGFQIVIFTDNRHPKDMLRSFSHELVHHGQNCNGQFEDIGSTEHGYAQSDPHLRSMEEDAFTRGNMIFRDWCDTCGSDNQLNETNYKKQGKTKMKINQSKIINIIKEELKKRSLNEAVGQLQSVGTWPKEKAAEYDRQKKLYKGASTKNLTDITQEFQTGVDSGEPGWDPKDLELMKAELGRRKETQIATELSPEFVGPPSPGAQKVVNRFKDISRGKLGDMKAYAEMGGDENEVKAITDEFLRRGEVILNDPAWAARAVPRLLQQKEAGGLTDEGEYQLKRYQKTLKRAKGEFVPKQKRDLQEQSAGTHSCASHVKENATGREGRPINHTLLEDGTVTHYTVEYENEIVEGVPSDKLTMLEIHSHGHRDDKPDSPHDKKKKRRRYKEEELKETEEAPLKEWFNESLYTRLIEKYTRKQNED